MLREVTASDVPIFFEHQLDEEARHMAAFVAEDPTDRDAHDAHWARLQANGAVTTRAIIEDDAVAGSIASFDREGDREVTYWIGREFWGRGLATRALTAFLEVEPTRPLWARVVKDNAGSRRVLEKCGFALHGEDKGYAAGRGCEVEEFVLRLE